MNENSDSEKSLKKIQLGKPAYQTAVIGGKLTSLADYQSEESKDTENKPEVT